MTRLGAVSARHGRLDHRGQAGGALLGVLENRLKREHISYVLSSSLQQMLAELQ